MGSKRKTSKKQSGGCFTWVGGIFVVCLIIALIKAFWKILLVVAVIAAIGYAIYTTFIKKNEELAVETVEITATPVVPSALVACSDTAGLPTLNEANITTDPPIALRKSAWQIKEEERIAREKAIETAIKGKKAEFEAALLEIPKVEISLSNPVERRCLKDMPEYSFSNITRKTRLDSIFPLVVLDVETTGFAPSKCEIVEIAAIKFDRGMEPISAFTTLCKPRKPIPEEASAVNHITDDMVADAPAFNQIAPALTDFLRGCHIAGHNLDFDLRFIFAHGADLPTGTRFYDTLDLAHLTIPESQIWNYKLKTICSYYGIIPSDSHRSLSDAYATSKIFSRLVLDKTDRQLDDSEEILSEKDSE